MPSSNASTPTSGIGVAAAVELTGVGVTPVIPTPYGGRQIHQYQVSIPIGGSVQVTASAVDVDDNPVANPVVSNPLNSAGNFAILGASAVTGSAGAGSVVSGGNIGISPNNASSVTNFPPSTLTSPGVFHYADAVALQAQVDLAAAIVYFQGLTPTKSGLSNLATGGNGSTAATYTPGNYFSAPASSLDIPTSITLDAQNNSAAVFVFVAGSTITLESGASVLLVNGAQAANVYWVNGSSFTSVDGGTSAMVGNILAHTSVTLGGGTLNGRALANIGAVTLSTTEVITAPASSGSVQQQTNAIVLAAAPGSSGYGYAYETLPAWYNPNPKRNYIGFATDMASATVDDDDSNPWTVRGRFPGQVVLYFQMSTFGGTLGQYQVDQNVVMSETYIDTIDAELIVTVTGGVSVT
jgi:hypothetical protein